MRTRNRFAKHSGCYTCRVCGKQTRETGHDESSCQLCAFCYIESGLENHHSDNGGCDEYNAACPLCNENRVNQITALCRDYGVHPPMGEHFLRGEEPQEPKLIDQLAEKLYEEVDATLRARINRGEFIRRDGSDFRVALEDEYGTADHPKAQRLWELAWAHGHASGLCEVMGYYEDFKTLIED